MTLARTGWRKQSMNRQVNTNHWTYLHGMTHSRFYSIWKSMKRRCCISTKNQIHQRYYVQKGIKVEWEDFISFKNDMYQLYLQHVQAHGEKNTTIDRIDNNKNYCKENCRWATTKEQSINKSSYVYYYINGEKLSLDDMAEKFNLPKAVLVTRRVRGDSGERLLRPAISRTQYGK